MNLTLSALAFLALSLPALADEATCTLPERTVADDKATMQSKGLPDYVYLGLRNMPFTDVTYVFYAFGGQVFASLLLKDGCVSTGISGVGPYVPEQGI